MGKRPRWWDWDLELSPHLLKRMSQRGFTEIDLRSMLKTASSVRTRHAMNGSYLEVTFRKGRALAAYLYLPSRARDRSVRTRRFPPGLVIDLAADGRPIGGEITAPSRVTVAALTNEVLRQHRCRRASDNDNQAETGRDYCALLVRLVTDSPIVSNSDPSTLSDRTNPLLIGRIVREVCMMSLDLDTACY